MSLSADFFRPRKARRVLHTRRSADRMVFPTTTEAATVRLTLIKPIRANSITPMEFSLSFCPGALFYSFLAPPRLNPGERRAICRREIGMVKGSDKPPARSPCLTSTGGRRKDPILRAGAHSGGTFRTRRGLCKPGRAYFVPGSIAFRVRRPKSATMAKMPMASPR